MLTLIWYEFKKLFLKKSTLVLIILITGLVYITNSDNMSYMNEAVENTIAYTDDMREVTSNELKAYDDENTCILCIKLTDGVLFSHGTRYDIGF